MSYKLIIMWFDKMIIKLNDINDKLNQLFHSINCRIYSRIWKGPKPLLILEKLKIQAIKIHIIIKYIVLLYYFFTNNIPTPPIKTKDNIVYRYKGALDRSSWTDRGPVPGCGFPVGYTRVWVPCGIHPGVGSRLDKHFLMQTL